MYAPAPVRMPPRPPVEGSAENPGKAVKKDREKKGIGAHRPRPPHLPLQIRRIQGRSIVER